MEFTKVSEIKAPSDDELDHAIEILLESEKIKKNDALYKHLIEYAGKKSKQMRSIKDLRQASEESLLSSLNPGHDRAEAETTEKPKEKKNEKKGKVD